MRDAEARIEIAKVKKAITEELPQTVANAVIAHFEARFNDVNATLDAMREAAEGIDALGQIVEKVGAATNDNGELLEVLESQYNELRVDFNAIREAQSQHAQEVAGVKSALGAMAEMFGKAAS